MGRSYFKCQQPYKFLLNAHLFPLIHPTVLWTCMHKVTGPTTKLSSVTIAFTLLICFQKTPRVWAYSVSSIFLFHNHYETQNTQSTVHSLLFWIRHPIPFCKVFMWYTHLYLSSGSHSLGPLPPFPWENNNKKYKWQLATVIVYVTCYVSRVHHATKKSFHMHAR